MQSDSKRWHDERLYRITSSRFGDIVAATERRDLEKLCESMFSNKPVLSASLTHGLKYENVALKKFSELQQVKICKSGVVICKDYPFLASSPDGIIQEENALVEIKCAYTGREQKIVPGENFNYLKLNEVTGKIELKKNHKYYIQVQSQMGICQKLKSYFVVYTHKDMFVQCIDFDNNFFYEICSKLNQFYTRVWRPFVARKILK